MQKIMFSDRFGLTQAVLDGRKTQSRRIINPQPRYDERVGMVFKKKSRRTGEWEEWMSGTGTGGNEPQDSYKNFAFTSKYKVGEVLAVAMSYKDIYERVGAWEYVEEYRRKHESLAGWNNKMFTNTKMPFAKIEITNVRVQRLQDITDDECLMEGIEEEERADGEYNYIFFDAKRKLYIRERTPRDSYARLINAISGKGTWDSNPYVIVYDFKLIK